MLPRGGLGIGVTGHRIERLGAARIDAVGAALAAVFAGLERAAHPIAPAALRLVTGLAEGADAIAADAAHARGWALDVVLPFFRDDYAADFAAGAERDAFHRRLGDCARIFELPGERDDDGHGAAYERAGRLVIAQADILVAVWDGAPPRGRGGTAQIVAEAVLRGVPVIHVDAAGARAPLLLWDGLEELDLGQQTVETVARGDLGALPALVRSLVDPPADPATRAILARFATVRTRRWSIAFAYPLLLAVMGIRRPRLADFTGRAAAGASPIHRLCAADAGFAAGLRDTLAPRFDRADAVATRVAQLFRSVYVTNFVFAALAVILSLLGLALPAAAKPVLIGLEVLVIGTILVQTRRGTRGAWHRRWLDHRALAERLRCLAISTQLGELDLRTANDRAAPWVIWFARTTAREIGLPSTRADPAYLACVRDALLALIDDQVAYLASDAGRMHRLEHRLHLLGTVMFAATVLACVGLLTFKALDAVLPALDAFAHPLAIATTIVSAALPAVGAAIYGIRMQGDFAGIAERSRMLADQLATLRAVIVDDAPGFDTLARRVTRVTGLLTEDLSSWLRTYHARPLALPG